MKTENWKLKIGIIACLILLTGIAFSDDAQAATTISRPINNLGLIGYWDFNTGDGTDIAWDRSGNGYNGRLTTMDPATDWVSGKPGQGMALDFDGTNDYVSTADIDFTTGGWTLSAWIKTTKSTLERILSKGAGGGGAQLWFQVSSGKLAIGWYVNSPLEDVNALSASSVNTGQWVHVVGVVGATSFQTYVNGVADGSPVSHDGTPVVNNSPWLMGSINGTGEFFDGQVDDVRMYNRALSADEIKRLYLSTQPKIATAPMSGGLVGYWSFDAGKGTDIAWDLSGNGNNGKLTTMDPATDWVNSKTGLGTALDFDGTDDNVNIDRPIYPTNTNWSVSAWVKSTDTAGVIYGEGQNGVNNERVDLFSLSSDKLRVRVQNSVSTILSGVSTTVVFDGVWHHVVFSDANGTAALYIDGVRDASDFNYTRTGSFPQDSSNIGCAQEVACNGPLAGQVDEVRLYNRALSADEIKRLYNMTKPEIAGVQLDKGLVGYWDFNFGKGSSIAFDRTSNGNNGRLTNMDVGSDWVNGRNSKLGQALDFDGTDDYVNAADPSSGIFDFGTSTNFAISMWAKIDAAGALISKLDASVTAGFDVFINANADNLNIRLKNSSNQTCKITSRDNGPAFSYYQGKWTHIVAIFTRNASCTGNDMYFYVDGVGFFGSTDTATINMNTNISSTEPLRIGATSTSDAVNSFINGQIDDVRIYNRLLTAEEAQRLYLMGK